MKQFIVEWKHCSTKNNPPNVPDRAIGSLELTATDEKEAETKFLELYPNLYVHQVKEK